MSFGRFWRRLIMVATSPGMALIAGIGSMVILGISPVVCAG